MHMRISSPAFLHPCYYGTDVDSSKGLIASNHSADEVAKLLGADSLGYLSLENAKKLAGKWEKHCCTACFSGDYPTELPKDTNKDKFEHRISEGVNS